MSLLASTSLGVDTASTRLAHVRVDGPIADGDYRLVVQSFDTPNGRPVSSAQRAVTASELREGVDVRFLELGASSAGSVVVAWVEAGAPDLEFDGRMARPGEGSIVGSARGGEDVHVMLVARRAA